MKRMAAITSSILSGCVTVGLVSAAVVAGEPTPMARVPAGLYGMYETNVVLAGRVRTRALLDTGAAHTTVMCTETALALGLRLGAPVQVQTANGITTHHRVTFPSVQIGEIVLRDVEGLVGEQRGGCMTLIGISVFRRIASVRIETGVMTLMGYAKSPGSSATVAAATESPTGWWLWGKEPEPARRPKR